MKTRTREEILKIIKNNEKIRPFELHKRLNISAQALHRHLRQLLKDGLLERRGSVPFTHYAMAGTPELEAVSKWLKDPDSPKAPSSLICETRDTFTSRLSNLKLYIRSGLALKYLPLVIAATAEVGNNCFDHNLGQWRDAPGCWFESQVTGGQLWITIADRGQGIYGSLRKVHPEIADDQSAIDAAFETFISGRAPEQRGNGLKFVRDSLASTSDGGLACRSGIGRVFYGDRGGACLTQLEKAVHNVDGTITLMVWKLS